MQTVGETRGSAMEDMQSNVDNSLDDSMNKHSDLETNQSEIDGRSYLLIHQSREKWENAYPFLFFSEAKNGWLCSVCSKYGKGDEFWLIRELSKRNTQNEFLNGNKNPLSTKKH